ncbi:MAG: ATP phosphoribosyltransferase regulatory subunit [Candidatus Caldatribacteriaceae bacterium]
MELVFGMKDVYPWEAKIRRAIETNLRNLFERWGYLEVEPPTLEYYTTLEKTLNEEMRERVYKFVDRDGKLVCLRPEFTTSVARMYSQDNNLSLPLRVYYSGRVFRYPSSPFRTESEFTQIGLENIGQGGVTNDAEVIALALLALEQAGIRNFEVDIGHAGIFRGLLEALPLGTPQKETARQLIKKRDFVTLEHLCLSVALPSSFSLLFRLPFLRGKKDLLKDLAPLFPQNREWQRAVEELGQVFEILNDFGLTERLSINMGLVRDFDYYTGIVFEGFSPQVGYPLLAGGRYDELFSVFGRDLPACGFALFLERVLEARQKEETLEEEKKTFPVLSFPPQLRKRAFQLAQALRQEGIALVLEEHKENSIHLATHRGLFALESLTEDEVRRLLKEGQR